MEISLAVLSITGAVALGAISPGPSFVLVARTAVAGSRTDGLAAALGMGAGGVCFAVAALLGLHLILHSVPWLDPALKLLGGAYLILLGGLVWRGAGRSLHLPEAGLAPQPPAFGCSFGLGLLTQLSNPKTVVIYASIFAALLPREFPRFVNFLLPLLIFLVEAGWYAVVALTLSTAAPRAFYLGARRRIDRATGTVLLLLALRLLVGAW